MQAAEGGGRYKQSTGSCGAERAAQAANGNLRHGRLGAASDWGSSRGRPLLHGFLACLEAAIPPGIRPWGHFLHAAEPRMSCRDLRSKQNKGTSSIEETEVRNGRNMGCGHCHVK